MNHQPRKAGSGQYRRYLGVSVAAVLAIWALACWLPQRALAARLLRADPEALLHDAVLLRYARSVAAPAFAHHCAACHGANGAGDRSRGVPSLVDADWLYGRNLVDLEQIVLYGIRSGHPRARNIAAMPAMGRNGQLTAGDIQDVVEYLQQLGGRPADVVGAARGRSVYFGKGNCFDCHAGDARGVTDYGTPPLTGSSWIYGGDRATLYQSIHDGRHGRCPGWVRTLTFVQIRALAVLLHEGVQKRD